MITVYDGDPAIFINNQGAYMKFIGGQPVMDPGLQNSAFISLFTAKGWVGNTLFKDENQRVGSDFEEENRKPITMTSLAGREGAANKALEWMKTVGLASNIGVEINNPNGSQINTRVLIEPLGADSLEFTVSKNGLNWVAQKTNPANERL